MSMKKSHFNLKFECDTLILINPKSKLVIGTNNNSNSSITLQTNHICFMLFT